MSSKRRKFVRTPVYIVEDHNEVLKYIYRAIGSRHLPFTNNIIVHFDSHPDLLIDKNLSENICWDKDKLLDDLSIENWILPGCYTGQFSQICWMKPKWSQQISDGVYEIEIGCDKEMKIRVGNDLYYFLSDGIFTDRNQLKNVKKFQLNVSTLSNTSSLTCLNSNSNEFILDIDLDFFSTQNPFIKMFKKGDLYRKVGRLFDFDSSQLNGDYQISINCAAARQRQLQLLENLFQHLNCYRTLHGFQQELPSECLTHVNDIINVVEEFYENDDFDWLILFNAGMTCDKSELPHHVSNENELSELYEMFEKFLKSTFHSVTCQLRPVLITIAKSTLDEYCPAEQVDGILNAVLTILKKLYGDLEVFEES